MSDSSFTEDEFGYDGYGFYRDNCGVHMQHAVEPGLCGGCEGNA